jgi:hypothetical protein
MLYAVQGDMHSLMAMARDLQGMVAEQGDQLDVGLSTADLTCNTNMRFGTSPHRVCVCLCLCLSRVSASVHACVRGCVVASMQHSMHK